MDLEPPHPLPLNKCSYLVSVGLMDGRWNWSSERRERMDRITELVYFIQSQFTMHKIRDCNKMFALWSSETMVLFKCVRRPL